MNTKEQNATATIYRDVNGNLFHEDGTDLTTEEFQELTALWQEIQVQDGNGSWDDKPCNWCGEAVCTCHTNLAAWFDLPPMEESESADTRHQPQGERVARPQTPRPQRPAWVR